MTIKEIQTRLNELGFGLLRVDGIQGVNTIKAIKSFQTKSGIKVDGIVGTNTLAAMFPTVVPINPTIKKGKLLTTPEIIAKYGEPGDKNLIQIQLPYPMRIAWDLSHSVTSISCHRLIANRLSQVFKDLLAHYGLLELQRLGIDLYAGCYNYRKMMGGNDWSRHAWGIALDLDSARNPLKASNKTAQFAKPEYKAMIDIFYNNGFVGLGPEKNYDWMHFQIGS